jgi:hypothetical protein
MQNNLTDPFGFNKAINWDKLDDPKVLEELKELVDDEDDIEPWHGEN